MWSWSGNPVIGEYVGLELDLRLGALGEVSKSTDQGLLVLTPRSCQSLPVLFELNVAIGGQCQSSGGEGLHSGVSVNLGDRPWISPGSESD